jgi:hypothetical protein
MNDKNDDYGVCEGDVCKRNGCKGIIVRQDDIDGYSSCSCHIVAPCSHCTDLDLYCTECDWQLRNEDDGRLRFPAPPNKPTVTPASDPYPRYNKDGNQDIRWKMIENGYAYEIIEGIYPAESIGVDKILKEIYKFYGGSAEYFGGKFITIENGKFKYKMYTD